MIKSSIKILLVVSFLIVVSGTLLCNIVYAYTPVEGLATAPQNQGNAVADTSAIVVNWTAAGHSGQALPTSYATKARIIGYLQNDTSLWRYNNIGHADTANQNGAACNGLYFYDAEWTSTQIYNLNPDYGLDSSRVFINSCNSFMNPLHDSFIHHYLSMYIGGLILLPQGASEDTCRDFWFNYINQNQAASTALSNAENAHGTVNDFGLYGS
jgi:hypothetical protein